MEDKNIVNCKNCNIVFIGIDALQAAHVHSLGYPKETTPQFDRLAQNGYLFTNAISPASWTVPAFMSIFTSTYPSILNMPKFLIPKNKTAKAYELPPSIVTIAQELKKHGYMTGGFTGDAGVGTPLGYGRGFDIYTDEVTFGGFENSQIHALKWLDDNRGKKFFMFFHGYDAHGHFPLPKNYRSIFEPKDYNGIYKGKVQEHQELLEKGIEEGHIQLSDQDVEFWRAWYDGKIKDADKRLGIFIDELKERGLYNNTIFVIFSDHGTEIYEHSRVSHGYTLYDELIRVPLLFIIPGAQKGKIINSQVSTMDIVPTILSMLDFKPSEELISQVKGRSLVPYLLDSKKKGEDVFSETDYREMIQKRAIRTTDGWKYILNLKDGQEELFNLKFDPGEKDNLINVEKEMSEKLRAKLFFHLEKDLLFDPDKKVITGCLPEYPDQCK